MHTVDLTTPMEQGGYAVFLPALSTFYLKQLAKLDSEPDFHGVDRLPPTFDRGHTGMNYLRPDAYYYYKWSLYSAGHARLDLSRAVTEESMVHQRPRQHSMILGDSGGYQVTKGVSHFKNINWDTFGGKGGDKIRQEILEWLEATADWSMTLDIPAVAIYENPKIKTFQDTLDLSIINLDYFVKHRTPGKTRFLNVLSGGSSENSKTWYDAVVGYNDPAVIQKMGYSPDRALEGFAFAGINKSHMRTVLERFLDLRDDGMLERADWIHFLGIGRLDWACYLTAIQRQIREHHNPQAVISFDAASAFVAASKGLTYTHNVFQPKRWGYNMTNAIDERTMKGSKLPMPFQSPIMDRLTVGDICRLGPGEPNKQGKVANTSWDNMSYLLLMAHSVYNHVQSVIEANRLVDYEMSRSTYQNVTYHDWAPAKKNCSSTEISDFVPSSVLYFNRFVEKLFDPANPNPRGMLEDNRRFLETISFGQKDHSRFDEFFATPVTQDPDQDLADGDDDDLRRLEDSQ